MISSYGIIRKSASQVAQAANRVCDVLAEGRIEQEPDFTSRMLGAIEEAMNNFSVKGVRWTAKTLTDRGPGAQEKQYGADFIGVLEISLPGYEVRKGFLAQAKLIEPNKRMASRDFHRMASQCERMLRLSPDSFVFLYSKQGVSVVPAISIVSVATSMPFTNPYRLYPRGIATFYQEHFASFIGDRNISRPDLATLLRLKARQMLYLAAAMG